MFPLKIAQNLPDFELKGSLRLHVGRTRPRSDLMAVRNVPTAFQFLWKRGR
jgi:hypothetical protein